MVHDGGDMPDIGSIRQGGFGGGFDASAYYWELEHSDTQGSGIWRCHGLELLSTRKVTNHV